MATGHETPQHRPVAVLRIALCQLDVSVGALAANVEAMAAAYRRAESAGCDVALFPELADVRIDYCWGGMVDMTQDRLPRAGERDGIFYSMGYSGHGTQMSTYMGAAMAEVLDGRADLNPWREFDWPPIPGHFGRPWFLPLVGAYYKFQDLIH